MGSADWRLCLAPDLLNRGGRAIELGVQLATRHRRARRVPQQQPDRCQVDAPRAEPRAEAVA